MKKFFMLMALSATLTCSQAATWFTTTLNNYVGNDTNSLIVASPVKLTSLILVGGNVGAYVNMWDNSVATNKIANAAYVSVTYATANYVSNYVTLGGITNNYTNSVIVTTLTTNSAGAVTLPKVATYYVPASTQVSIDNPNIQFSRGIVMGINTNNTLSTPITAIGSYAPLY